MSVTNDGGSAFPVLPPAVTDCHAGPPAGYPYPEAGMTLRDYAAIHIAAGMAAFSGTSGLSYGPGEIAGRAYQVADAMLAARDEASK